MDLILKIAAAIVLGVAACLVLFGVFPEWLRQTKIEQDEAKRLQRRFERAEAQGFGGSTLYELEKWERKHQLD